MTDPNAHRRLLATLLAAQPEPRAPAFAFTNDRIRAAVTGTQPLSPEEKKLLWQSPDARDHYHRMRRVIVAELREAMLAGGLGRAEPRLAAAGQGSDGRIEGEGFHVVILAPEEEDEPWSILVEVEEQFARRVPAGFSLTLSDDGGHVWASGVPDETGRFGNVWTAEQSPWSRHAAHGLTLSP
jgi:hypothetical protein